MLNTLVVGDLHADRKRKVTYGDSSIWDDRVFECLQKIVTVEKPDLIRWKADSFNLCRFFCFVLFYVSKFISF